MLSARCMRNVFEWQWTIHLQIHLPCWTMCVVCQGERRKIIIRKKCQKTYAMHNTNATQTTTKGGMDVPVSHYYVWCMCAHLFMLYMHNANHSSNNNNKISIKINWVCLFSYIVWVCVCTWVKCLCTLSLPVSVALHCSAQSVRLCLCRSLHIFRLFALYFDIDTVFQYLRSFFSFSLVFLTLSSSLSFDRK